MSDTRVLVAGIGNIFLSDDGFGSVVAGRLLAERALPPGVEVVDVGIRGMHLAYRLLDGYSALVIVDITHGDGPPGTLYLLEHDLSGASGDAAFNPHGMDPDSVLELIDALAHGVGADQVVDRVLVLGCEPADVGEGMGLSPAVAAAVDRAVEATHRVVGRLLDDGTFQTRCRDTGEISDDQESHDPGPADGSRPGGPGDVAGHQAVPAHPGHVAAADLSGRA